MAFINLEMQTANGQTAIVTPVQYASKDEAESAWHHACGYAAVSSVQKHTCMIITDEGEVIRSECYRHDNK